MFPSRTEQDSHISKPAAKTWCAGSRRTCHEHACLCVDCQCFAHARVQVLQLLLASTEAEEEVRGVLAECLGHLALLDPANTLPALRSAAADGSPAARAAVVTAVKHAVVEAPHAVDAPLQAALPGFLAGIQDPDRSAVAGGCIALHCTQTDHLCAVHLDSTMPASTHLSVAELSKAGLTEAPAHKLCLASGEQASRAVHACSEPLSRCCP